MIKTTSILIGLVLILFLGGLLYVHASAVGRFLFGYSVNAASTARPAFGHPQGAGTPIGLPAITPKTDTSTTTGPTFTLDDARAYITAHPFHKGITTTGQPSSISDIYFTTDKQAADLIKSDPGLPPATQVLVVIENGPFLLDNTSWPQGETIPTAEKVISVFNAHTGNLLMWGEWK